MLVRESVLSTVFDLTKIDNLGDSVKRLRDIKVDYTQQSGRPS